MSNPLMSGPARVTMLARGALAGLAVVCALSACRANGRDGAALPAVAQVDAPTPPDEPAAVPRVDGMQSATLLPGAGAVAFDADSTRIAWSTGSDVRILALPVGAVAPLAAGAGVADLGYAPDGALWTVGGDVSRWRDGKRDCTAPVDADRLLAVDAQGVVVAGYDQADGQGMLRRQVWLDNDCRTRDERIDPLPADVADAESDPGAPLKRDSLRPPRARGAAIPALPQGAQAIASSADGRYWIVEAAGERKLHDAGAK